MFSLKRLLIIICFLLNIFIKSQDTDYKLSLVTTGVSVNMLKNHKLTLYGGYGTNKQQFFRVYPTFRINKYLSLTPGYTFNDTYSNHTDNYEHHLMAVGSINIPLDKDKKWSITNRNMYHYKIRRHKENISFYRNRIGINYRTTISDKTINLFLNEEFYLSLNGKGLYRNQISVGGDLRLPWLTPQLMYIYQTTQNSKSEHLFNLSFVIPLENFGFFK